MTALEANWLTTAWVAGGLVQVGMATIVFATRPDRLQNKFLAAYFFLLGLWLLSGGLQYAATSPSDVYALSLSSTFPVLLLPLAYVLFLGTLPSPLAAPLRRRAVRAAFAASTVLLVASLLVRPGLWQRGVAPGLVTPWVNVPGPMFGVVDGVALVVNLAALAIAYTAWRRATAPLVRRQMKLYAIGFGGYDLLFIAVLVTILHAIPTTGEIFAPPWLMLLLGPVVLLATLWLAAWLGYGILSAQLFDIQLRVKWTLSRGTLAAVFLAVFFVGATVASEFLTGTLGYAVGGVAAGLLLFALAPLQRFAERVADRAMPRVRDTDEYRLVRKREVYRAAVEGAAEDGIVTDRERTVLARLADQLGLSASDALAIEREAIAAAKEVA